MLRSVFPEFGIAAMRSGDVHAERAPLPPGVEQADVREFFDVARAALADRRALLRMGVGEIAIGG